MSIQIKKITRSAKSLVSNSNGSYDIFSDVNIVIPVKKSVSIRTGLMVSLPLGYYGLVHSSDIIEARNVEVNYFSSLHYQHNRATDTVNKPREFILNLHNRGEVECRIQVGDVIGKLVVLATKDFPVKVVESLEHEIDIEEVKKDKINLPKIKAIDKTAAFWFKKKYQEFPNDFSFIKKLDKTLPTKIKAFRLTEKYKSALNKVSVESNFVWDSLSSEKKVDIQTMFEDEKKLLLAGDEESDSDEDLDEIAAYE